jgi:hypothetical protein
MIRVSADCTARERRLKAEADFRNAQQLQAGSRRDAIEYGQAWHETYARRRWARMTEAQRAQVATIVGEGAAACAKKIVADGRAHYAKVIGGRDYLVVCSLIPDASAGPVGYDLWDLDRRF